MQILNIGIEWPHQRYLQGEGKKEGGGGGGGLLGDGENLPNKQHYALILSVVNLNIQLYLWGKILMSGPDLVDTHHWYRNILQIPDAPPRP